jgi:NAD(P)-dependent dehydrogenase (short-subunit alcohol dehydrogenase family)
MRNQYEHRPLTVEDKQGVVIGGTSGIGRAISLALAHEGADVIASSRSIDKVEDTATELRDLGVTTTEIICDVTDRQSLVDLADKAVNLYDDLDFVVVSVSKSASEPLLEGSDDEWEATFDVQLTGVYRCIQEFGKRMDSGTMTLISSLAADLSGPAAPAHATSKAGLDSLTRVAAEELAPKIRVNAIKPGWTAVDDMEDAYPEGSERYQNVMGATPMDRFAQPEEIASAAVYLSSDAPGFMTGATIRLDGGFLNTAY